jgi:hypothetical protein
MMGSHSAPVIINMMHTRNICTSGPGCGYIDHTGELEAIQLECMRRWGMLAT